MKVVHSEKAIEDKKMELRQKLSDYLCKNHSYFTDFEFRKFCDFMWSQIPITIFYRDMKLEGIVEERVKIHCAANKIDLVDYDGPLPYRLFKIPVSSLTYDETISNIKRLTGKR